MSKVSREQFIKGTAWKILERFAARGISLVVSIFLSRLLLPEDYGLIALTTVFINLSDILIDGGFGTALIRKDQVDEEDYNCVFTISILMSIFLYIILFFISPVVALYYNEPDLTSVLRVMGLVLFIQAFSSTRNAYVNRNMQFKLLMKCNTVSSLISGAGGIGLAYLGLGVWALAIQRLMQQTIVTILLFVKIKWKPHIKFNKNKFSGLFKFSIGVIGSSFINYIENCLNSLVVGKHYSVADLGYYDKGNLLPEQISLNTFGAMTNVLLPTISSYQDDKEKVKQVIRKVVRYTCFLLFPVMLGLLMVSEDAVIVLFTDKWLNSVPLMRSICIYYIATPLMLIDVQVFFALGHSAVRVKTEIIRLAFLVVALIICCFIFNLDIKFLSLFNAIAVCAATIVTHYEVRKMIKYSLIERMKDSWKSIISAVIMSVMILIISNYIPEQVPTLLSLIIKVLFGIIVYFVFELVFKDDVLKDILALVKRKRA